MATIDGEFYTTTEAAEYLGFAEDTIRRYIYRGLISAEKVGAQYLISREECDRYDSEKRGPGSPGKKSQKKS